MPQGALPDHLQRRMRPTHDNANSGAHPCLLQLNQTGQNINLTTLIWHYNPKIIFDLVLANFDVHQS